MLNAGGRYVCGNPNSQMPVWADTGNPPGPLNYTQIDDLIAFIRAPSTETYIVRDASLFEPEIDPITGQVKTFKGWVDPNYKPDAGATPVSRTAGRTSSRPAASAAPSGSRVGGAVGLGRGVRPGRHHGLDRRLGDRLHHDRRDRPGRHRRS